MEKEGIVFRIGARECAGRSMTVSLVEACAAKLVSEDEKVATKSKGVIAGTLTCNFWRLCTRAKEMCGEIRGEAKERVNVCSFFGLWLLSSQSVKCQLFNCLIVCQKNEGK